MHATTRILTNMKGVHTTETHSTDHNGSPTLKQVSSTIIAIIPTKK